MELGLVSAEKLQVDIGKDASKRPGATGGGGGNVYRPPHRSNNQQQQQQPHSNSSGGGQSAYTSDQPMSPEVRTGKIIRNFLSPQL